MGKEACYSCKISCERLQYHWPSGIRLTAEVESDVLYLHNRFHTVTVIYDVPFLSGTPVFLF